MQKRWRLAAAEQTGELNLPAGGRKKVDAANHQRHALHVVVDGGRELVRPVALAVARKEIAALVRGPLLLGTEPQIDEALNRGLEPNAEADTGAVRESSI